MHSQDQFKTKKASLEGIQEERKRRRRTKKAKRNQRELHGGVLLHHMTAETVMTVTAAMIAGRTADPTVPAILGAGLALGRVGQVQPDCVAVVGGKGAEMIQSLNLKTEGMDSIAEGAAPEGGV